MKIVKSNKLKKIILGSVGALFAATLAITPVAVQGVVSADGPVLLGGSSSSISISMYDNNNHEIVSTEKNVTVNDEPGKFYSTNWKDIAYFDIDCSGIAIEAGLDNYSFQYNITWAPIELVEDGSISLQTDWVEQGTVLTGTKTQASAITKQIRFYIADIGTLDSHSYNASSTYIGTGSSRSTLKAKQETRGAWGVYQFTFKVNENSYVSKLFEVKPTKVETISTDLEVKSTTSRSKYSINNAYTLTVEGDEYQYVNRENLVWKISGKGADGKSYVLLPEDIEEGDTTTKSLISDNSFNRTGTTFVFDTETGGNWQITCEAKSTDGLNDKVSEAVEVSTIRLVPSYLYIIIIGAAVVAAIIILVIVIVVTKKKEKIW